MGAEVAQRHFLLRNVIETYQRGSCRYVVSRDHITYCVLITTCNNMESNIMPYKSLLYAYGLTFLIMILHNMINDKLILITTLRYRCSSKCFQFGKQVGFVKPLETMNS